MSRVRAEAGLDDLKKTKKDRSRSKREKGDRKEGGRRKEGRKEEREGRCNRAKRLKPEEDSDGGGGGGSSNGDDGDAPLIRRATSPLPTPKVTVALPSYPHPLLRANLVLSGSCPPSSSSPHPHPPPPYTFPRRRCRWQRTYLR